MSGTVTLFDPTAPGRVDDTQNNFSVNAIAGKVVGFIDNAKPNFNHLVDDIADLLTGRYGVTRVIKRRKKSASVPAPDSVLREITDQCDVVITGSGD
jgi:hypothetical protein